MRSGTHSLQMRSELRALGKNISIARRLRGMTQSRLAEGAGLNVGTIRRLEQGHPSVSLGTLAMVFLVLGETGKLENLLDLSQDHLGLALGIESLPQRVRVKRRGSPHSGQSASEDWTAFSEDDGVF